MAIHQLAPSETAGSVSRFLDHWHPDAAVILGTPNRPNLVTATDARNIPLFLAAPERGQMAPGGKLPQTSVAIMQHFQAFLVPSAAEAQAFQFLDVPSEKVIVSGPLSDTVLALACDSDALEHYSQLHGGRPVWLAAQITNSEFDAVEKAQRRTIRGAHRLLLIIVPRNPTDGPSITAKLDEKGWRTALRSRGEMPDEAVQVFVADDPDEMGLWYRLAPVAFLGGTLDSVAEPTDPFDPAALGSALIHGPEYLPSFERYQRLIEADATSEIAFPDELGDAVFQLLSPDKAAMLAHAGWAVTSESAHVVEQLAELIDISLDELGAS